MGGPVVHNRRCSIGLAGAVIAAASLAVAACGGSSAPKAASEAKAVPSASASALVVSNQEAQSVLNGLIGAKSSNGGGLTVTAVSLVDGSQTAAKGGAYTVKANVTYSDGSIILDTVTVEPDGSVSATPDSQERNATAPATTDPNGQTCSALDGQGYCPGDNPSPSAAPPTMTKQTDTVVFRVSGTGDPSIQYGTDSSTNNPSNGVGPLGDGNDLPWTASMPYSAGALYYAVTAQLQGSGSVQDLVTEVVTTWCSGSKPKTETFPLASGNASGGYGIATAEYDGGDTGNAAQAESDAGC